MTQVHITTLEENRSCVHKREMIGVLEFSSTCLIGRFLLINSQIKRIVNLYADDIQLLYLSYECVNEGAVSHFSLFREGRAEEKQSQGGNSVQRGKELHEGPRNLGGSNILPHNPRQGHGGQSGYSRNQPRMAVERQSPWDSNNLKESQNKSTLERLENQSGLLPPPTTTNS